MASRKRRVPEEESDDESISKLLRVEADAKDTELIISTVEEAIDHVRNLFPVHKYEGRILPIIWRHQLYSLLADRTAVDRKLQQLSKDGEVRFFKLGTTLGINETVVSYFKDYRTFIRKNFKGDRRDLLEKFIKLVKHHSDVFHGLLVTNHRAIGTWLFSIPNAGLFIRELVDARKTLVKIFKSTKHNEIFKNELRKKKLPKKLQIGLDYVLLDLIGSETMLSVNSPSGTLLRLLRC
ncbi:Serine/threonine-protein kinase 19 [Halotydeus destructor]|nr:Serine/threonine-protein kinase 19 [Halotydeus destructor]